MSLMDHIEKMMEANSPFEIEDIQTDEYSYDSIKTLLSEYVKSGSLRRYSQGIYYIPKTTPYGETEPRFEDVVKKKYIYDHGHYFGYFTGQTLLNRIGISEQFPFVLEITTNKEATRKREIEMHRRRAVLRKSTIEITDENVRYLQFIDIFRYASKNMIQENMKYVIHFFNYYQLNVDELKKYALMSTSGIRNKMRELHIYDVLAY